MAFLVIGKTEKDRIAKAIAYAKAHPLSLDLVKHGLLEETKTLSLADRETKFKQKFVRPESAHVTFPGGYRAAISYEQQPVGMCSHLSISVEGRRNKGMLPSPPAVQMIAEAFGVPFPPDKGWTEEFEPGEYAINLLSVIGEPTVGTA